MRIVSKHTRRRTRLTNPPVHGDGESPPTPSPEALEQAAW